MYEYYVRNIFCVTICFVHNDCAVNNNYSHTPILRAATSLSNFSKRKLLMARATYTFVRNIIVCYDSALIDWYYVNDCVYPRIISICTHLSWRNLRAATSLSNFSKRKFLKAGRATRPSHICSQRLRSVGLDAAAAAAVAAAKSKAQNDN